MSVLDPAVALLHALLELLAGRLPGPASVQVAAAIVLVTMTVRLLLLPAAARSLRAQRARAALLPELTALREQHGHDREALRREIQELHRSAGVSLFAGFGPMLVTAAITMTLYRMISLLGAPLGTHWLPLLSGGDLLTAGVLTALLVALLLVALLSSRQQPPGPRLLRVFPFVTAAFAVAAPLAVSIYLLSSTAWTVAERALLPRVV